MTPKSGNVFHTTRAHKNVAGRSRCITQLVLTWASLIQSSNPDKWSVVMHIGQHKTEYVINRERKVQKIQEVKEENDLGVTVITTADLTILRSQIH